MMGQHGLANVRGHPQEHALLHARYALLLVLLLTTVAAAGCTVPSGDGPILVLRFTLHDTSGEDGEANPGPHCGTAAIRDGRLHVERGALKEAGGRPPFLVVLPSLGPGWASYGSEGYPMALPGAVPTGIPGEPMPVARVDWSAEDGPQVDGVPVGLPHSWSVEGEGWRADAVLEDAPTQTRLFRAGPCM